MLRTAWPQGGHSLPARCPAGFPAGTPWPRSIHLPPSSSTASMQLGVSTSAHLPAAGWAQHPAAGRGGCWSSHAFPCLLPACPCPRPGQALGRAGAPMLPGSLSTNRPSSPPPHAPNAPIHAAGPLPPSMGTYLLPHACGWAPWGRGHTPATSSRHIITCHWDPGAASWGFLSGWHGSPRQKTPSRLLRSWKTFFFLPYMSCRRRPGCRRALLSGAPRGSIGWGAVTWPRRRDPPPRSRVLLLPPKEGLLDNFHISSKFGDFRQC